MWAFHASIFEERRRRDLSNLDALSVARYFIELSAGSDENDLTNLKLQKLLYFAQTEYLKQENKPLFADDIEAWVYGPVVRAVYSEYKSCGSFPITPFDGSHACSSFRPLPKSIRNFLEGVWKRYGLYSASHLVSLTHQPGGPWRRYYDRGANSAIPLSALKAIGEQ